MDMRRAVTTRLTADADGMPAKNETSPDSPSNPIPIPSSGETLICFSHLRWRFVTQRPQHLMTRFARRMRVFFIEEPLTAPAIPAPTLETIVVPGGVTVVVPHLPATLDEAAAGRALRRLLDELCAGEGIVDPILWYYTPMSRSFSDHLKAAKVIYDCMDELSTFKGAPPSLAARERELLAQADLVFTGGRSLFEAKRHQHPRVHAFPSSIDRAHFAQARAPLPEPADQAALPSPRLGFFGVLDERLDTGLLDALARRRPDWQFILIGPVVKIDPADLPRRPNLHYLGPKDYAALPAYVAGWDVAIMPFAINEATRFISPTKTPEFLAAGRPVVSTPILDVAREYGETGLVAIAGTVPAFEAAVAAALDPAWNRGPWLDTVDRALTLTSWDATWERMMELIDQIPARTTAPPAPRARPTPLRGARRGFDYLVVGAGFAGSVMAERLAAGSGKRVLLVERRPHIGGNAYDVYDDAGILIHRYGPHIFHTNSRPVAEYLSRFTEWRPYEHRVLARVGGGLLVPIPINLTTVNRLYGLNLTPETMESWLKARAEPVAEILTSEDVVVSKIGRELYETFFRGYSRKQWGIDPSDLDRSVTARVPTRTNTDDRYFTDTFQMMPRHGFTRMFERMLDHPNIKIMLNTDFREVVNEVEYDKIIYTGPIDGFFDCRYGKLPYRSLEFRHETLDRETVQPVAVVNHPDPGVPYTRVTEYKHLTGQKHPKTSISYEFPCDDGDPYYPVPRPENARLFAKYQALADRTPNVAFVGRLATYRYYNMDQVVAQALALYNRISAAEARKADQSVTVGTLDVAG